MKKEMQIRSVLRTIEKQPYDWNEAITIVKVLKGRIRIRVWEADYVLSRGDFIIFNVGEMYYIEEVTKENLVSLTYIDADYCRSIVYDFDDVVIYCNSIIYEKRYPCLFTTLRRYIKELIACIVKNQKAECIHEINLIATKLINYLCCHFDYTCCGIKLKKFSKKVIERNKFIYKSAIRLDGELKNHSLKEISKHVGVSYEHMRKDVIKRFGHGFKWLKFNVRVREAAKMILLTDKNITYIGYMCGFSDPKYLIQSFKSYYRCTPSQFRNLYKDRDSEKSNYIEYPLSTIMKYDI